MMYSVGDIVKIRTGLKIGSVHGNCEFVVEMQKFEGCIAIISEVIPEQEQYKINIDSSKYFWNNNMFKLTLYQRLIKRLKAIK